MHAATASMYAAAIMQQPIITITLIIVSLLNSYFDGVPTTATGLALPAPDYSLEARPEPDVNYFAVGATAGRALPAFCIFHSTPSFLSLKLRHFIIACILSGSRFQIHIL